HRSRGYCQRGVCLCRRQPKQEHRKYIKHRRWRRRCFCPVNMRIEDQLLADHNQELLPDHREGFAFLSRKLERQNTDAQKIVQKLMDFQIAVPSWALGTGGTRFGRFSQGGEPRTLEEKIEDVALLHALN